MPLEARRPGSSPAAGRGVQRRRCRRRRPRRSTSGKSSSSASVPFGRVVATTCRRSPRSRRRPPSRRRSPSRRVARVARAQSRSPDRVRPASALSASLTWSTTTGVGLVAAGVDGRDRGPVAEPGLDVVGVVEAVAARRSSGSRSKIASRMSSSVLRPTSSLNAGNLLSVRSASIFCAAAGVEVDADVADGRRPAAPRRAGRRCAKNGCAAQAPTPTSGERRRRRRAISSRGGDRRRAPAASAAGRERRAAAGLEVLGAGCRPAGRCSDTAGSPSDTVVPRRGSSGAPGRRDCAGVSCRTRAYRRGSSVEPAFGGAAREDGTRAPARPARRSGRASSGLSPETASAPGSVVPSVGGRWRARCGSAGPSALPTAASASRPARDPTTHGDQGQHARAAARQRDHARRATRPGDRRRPAT